jgi:MFS family permease
MQDASATMGNAANDRDAADTGPQAGTSTGPASPYPPLALRAPWLGIVFLMLIGLLNYLDRVLPSILAEAIKRDLVLSDMMIGLINGLGFLAIYALASIPIATMSDRGRYNLVISGALAIWSLMTMVGGLVANGWQLALTRSGVALGEAGGMPAAHAFITRHIPAGSRARALSLYTACVPLGTMSGFVVGGVIGEWLGWRNTFLLMGGIGVALALLSLPMFGVKRLQPASNGPETEAPAPSIAPLLRKRSLYLILAGASFMGMGGYTAMAFSPAFLIRIHQMSMGQAGIIFGIAGGCLGIAGLFVTGWLSDRLSQRDRRWWPGLVIATNIVALPLSIAGFMADHLWLAMTGLAANIALATIFQVPLIGALHALAPVALRARVSALLLLATAVLGGLGPLAAGILSDHLQPALGDEALRYALLLVPGAFIAASLCLLAAIPFFAGEIHGGEDEQG